jgi:hypothetical protein
MRSWLIFLVFLVVLAYAVWAFWAYAGWRVNLGPGWLPPVVGSAVIASAGHLMAQRRSHPR